MPRVCRGRVCLCSLFAAADRYRQGSKISCYLCFLSSLAVEVFREVIRPYTGPTVCGQEFVPSETSSA